MKFAGQIALWRDKWESDPAITFKSIAEEIGCSMPTVANQAKREQWEPEKGVVEARRKLGEAKRYAASRAATSMSCAAPKAGSAWPSIFHAAAGNTVATGQPGAEGLA